jgi:hypothetical protein
MLACAVTSAVSAIAAVPYEVTLLGYSALAANEESCPVHNANDSTDTKNLLTFIFFSFYNCDDVYHFVLFTTQMPLIVI